MPEENDNATVQVAVRLRPFNKRELAMGTSCVVEMDNNQCTILNPPKSGGLNASKNKSDRKVFTFDHCFWSMDPTESRFASQEDVYNAIGTDFLDSAFKGYNACIFAYGQTGSGKSYSMMGSSSDPGIIPRLCRNLFERINKEKKENKIFNIEVSYLEIYNEKVRDLLDFSDGIKNNLKVRENQLTGPYVEGLTTMVATSAQDIESYISDGTKSRTVAATKMNAESSRSHAVFTILFQRGVENEKGEKCMTKSKISLVDLAGSERSSKTGAKGKTLKEGSNINKSLTTLGLVISALADSSKIAKKGKKGKQKIKFIPYRDSTLTWILKDNLGGNSVTTMMATLSPAGDNYDETLSTLRYADRAKQIVNTAVINEDENAKTVRLLQEQLESLEQQLKESKSQAAPELQAKLEESERLQMELTRTWEEKLKQTDEMHRKRQEAFEKMGISVQKAGIKVEKKRCFLVNLNPDPMMNELLVFYLKCGECVVGQSEASDIQLSGLGIAEKHALLTVDENTNKVICYPLPDARTCVNGKQITEATAINHGDRILWGNNHYFRVNVPKLPENEQYDRSINDTVNDTIHLSYDEAKKEVLLNQDDGNDGNFSVEATIDKLEREFAMIDKPNGLLVGVENGSSEEEIFGAKERQRYEQEIHELREKLSNMEPLDGAVLHHSASMPTNLTDTSRDPHHYHPASTVDRKRAFKESLVALREELMRCRSLVEEANALSVEMNRETVFTVTLRIPARNLTPNRPEGAIMCEPAVQVVREGKDQQIWCVETLSNRLVDMRELYHTFRFARSPDQADDVFKRKLTELGGDPFSQATNQQTVIGVANLFLACLLQDHPLVYSAPIINQHGQVAGKLKISIQRVAVEEDQQMLKDEEDGLILPPSRSQEDLSSNDFGSYESNLDQQLMTSPPTSSHDDITSMVVRRRRRRLYKIRVKVMEAQGLQSTLSHFVQCQYTFPGEDDVTIVPPSISPDEISPTHQSTLTVRFDHEREFVRDFDEDFTEQLQYNDSLAFEVWGHRNRYIHKTHKSSSSIVKRDRTRSRDSNQSIIRWPASDDFQKTIAERWAEVTRRLRMDIQIEEPTDSGNYEAVEVEKTPNTSSCGCFLLRQGYSRRINIRIEPVDGSGSLPLLCHSVSSVYAGNIVVVAEKNTSEMDSYQEKDSIFLSEEWLDALSKRKEHLSKQFQSISRKEVKTVLERERQSTLFYNWMKLQEEMQAAHTPTIGIPGSPADSQPLEATEMHVPLIYLNINPEEVDNFDFMRQPAGNDCQLTDEETSSFRQLHFVRCGPAEVNGAVSAVVAWDASIHDSTLLNVVTPATDAVYVIIKVFVRLSHPTEMDLVLRKRIRVSVYRKKPFGLFRKRIEKEATSKSGVFYEIISSLPIASSLGDDHETRALLAASKINSTSDSEIESSSDDYTFDQVTSFEHYVMNSSRSVDNILALDRLKQEMALREVVISETDSLFNHKDSLDALSVIYKNTRATSVYSGYPHDL